MDIILLYISVYDIFSVFTLSQLVYFIAGNRLEFSPFPGNTESTESLCEHFGGKRKAEITQCRARIENFHTAEVRK